jgi:hypothetical protein
MKNNLGIKNMRICPHAIRVLEKNSNPGFRVKELSPKPAAPAAATAGSA